MDQMTRKISLSRKLEGLKNSQHVSVKKVQREGLDNLKRNTLFVLFLFFLENLTELFS